MSAHDPSPLHSVGGAAYVLALALCAACVLFWPLVGLIGLIALLVLLILVAI